jgi:uncharacterized protein YoxC
VFSMMVTWQLVAVILLAVLVGAAVPVLVQLRRTLRSAENLFNSTGPKLDSTLDELGEAASRVNRLGKTLEKDAEGLGVFTDAVAGLGRSLKQAQDTLRIVTAVGAAVGPAVAAGLQALFTRDHGDDAASPHPVEGSPAPGGRGDGRPVDGHDTARGQEEVMGHD